MVSEGTYTPKSDWCRFPELWHAPDIDATEVEATNLVASFVCTIKPQYVIETGSYLGHTSRAIGLALKENGNGGHLHTFEVDEKRYNEALKKIVDLPVTAHLLSSLDFKPERQIDFAFFDSFFELRKQEFLKFREFMDKGTIVSFHDTAPHHKTVLKDLIELEQNGYLKAINLKTPRGIAFAEVL